MKKIFLFSLLGLIGIGSLQTVKAESQIYAALSSDEKTMTLYYDEQRDPADKSWWQYNYATVTKVVLEESMKDARPESTLYWFNEFDKLTEIEHLDYLNTSEVTDMRDMFQGCEALTSLDLSHFDTQKVTLMSTMFYGCESLTSLDLTSFDTKNVTDMNMMFGKCEALTTIYCNEDWNLISTNLTTSNNMFGSCFALVGENGTAYQGANPHDVTYARPDDPANGEPGYFTKKKAPQTKSMTPTWGDLRWDELHQQWCLASYELDASDNPLFFFGVGVDGVKEVLPTTFVLSNSTDDQFIFVDVEHMEDFGGVVKDAAITITVDGSGYQYDAIGAKYYLLAKFSGELNDADGNKLIVNEPADFIKLFVPTDVATAIDEISNDKMRKCENVKIILGGQLFIMRDGVMYNAQGAVVE